MEKKYNKYFRATLVLICFFILNLFSTNAQNGPVCDTYTNASATLYTGLGNPYNPYSFGMGGVPFGVYASGSTVYAATGGGLSISTNGGVTFTNKTTENGLGYDIVIGVYASGSTVYAATVGGLSISTDGGGTFTNKTTANGLGDNWVRGVYASGSTVYAATSGGLSILNAESIPACTNGNETVSGIGGPGKGTGADHYGVAISGYTLIRCICQSLQASFLRCAMVRSNHI